MKRVGIVIVVTLVMLVLGPSPRQPQCVLITCTTPS